MTIEDLGWDKDREPSSQPLCGRRSKYRGRRKKEIGGKWKIVSGYCWESTASIKAAHGEWAHNLSKLGFRVGSVGSDGVTNYAIFIPNESDKNNVTKIISRTAC